MSRRRNPVAFIEDTFADMDLTQQEVLLRVLEGLHRQKIRNGAALADTKPAPQPEPIPMFGGAPK